MISRVKPRTNILDSSRNPRAGSIWDFEAYLGSSIIPWRLKSRAIGRGSLGGPSTSGRSTHWRRTASSVRLTAVEVQWAGAGRGSIRIRPASRAASISRSERIMPCPRLSAGTPRSAPRSGRPPNRPRRGAAPPGAEPVELDHPDRKVNPVGLPRQEPLADPEELAVPGLVGHPHDLGLVQRAGRRRALDLGIIRHPAHRWGPPRLNVRRYTIVPGRPGQSGRRGIVRDGRVPGRKSGAGGPAGERLVDRRGLFHNGEGRGGRRPACHRDRRSGGPRTWRPPAASGPACSGRSAWPWPG